MTMKYGTIHKRHCHFFLVFDTPLPAPCQWGCFTSIHRQISMIEPFPRQTADVFYGRPLSKSPTLLSIWQVQQGMAQLVFCPYCSSGLKTFENFWVSASNLQCLIARTFFSHSISG
jgi:hypothetical protein